jgi:hypothetical protein
MAASEAQNAGDDTSPHLMDHDRDHVAGCSAPLSCGVAARSGLAPRHVARRIFQITTIMGLLAAGAGCLMLMLLDTIYVLSILIAG